MPSSIHYEKQAISVDCVIFGFDGSNLKVLLTKRKDSMGSSVTVGDYKLPGSLISNNENIDDAVKRVLNKYLGKSDIFMRQFEVFSTPNRISPIELDWLNKYYNSDIKRVLTVAYYSLVKLAPNNSTHSEGVWQEVDDVKCLALDHNTILTNALSLITSQIQREPIAFELLSKEFTIKELRVLYEAIIGVELDSRNFRKKMLNSGYIVITNKKEKGVNHKPAMYYRFNKRKYMLEINQRNKINFLNLNI